MQLPDLHPSDHVASDTQTNLRRPDPHAVEGSAALLLVEFEIRREEQARIDEEDTCMGVEVDDLEVGEVESQLRMLHHIEEELDTAAHHCEAALP